MREAESAPKNDPEVEAFLESMKDVEVPNLQVESMTESDFKEFEERLLKARRAVEESTIDGVAPQDPNVEWIMSNFNSDGDRKELHIEVFSDGGVPTRTISVGVDPTAGKESFMKVSDEEVYGAGDETFREAA